jgi:DivIVA domain-containing protein
VETNGQNIQFDIVKKGYDPEQVQDYIKMVAAAYSELYASHEQLQEYIAQLEADKKQLEQQIAGNTAQYEPNGESIIVLQNRITQLETEKRLLEQQSGRMYLRDLERDNAEQQLRSRIAQLESSVYNDQSKYTDASANRYSSDNRFINQMMTDAEKTAAQIVDNAKVKAQLEADKIRANAFSEAVRLLHMMDDVTRTVMEMKRLVGGSQTMT